MMERFISRGLICKCATHFSPPAKKTKLTLIQFLRTPSEKKRKFCEEKRREKRGSFALGFADSREGHQGFLLPFITRISNLHLNQWLQVCIMY